MSVSIEPAPGGKRSFDMEVNLVPFIDMMSCLVAFLLFTAVWTNLAQVHAKPKGAGVQALQEAPPRENLSLLVARDGVWVGTSASEAHLVPRVADAYDWDAVAASLAPYRRGAFATRDDIEIAGEDGVQYQAIIAAMDVAVAQGFEDVGYVDPASLTARFAR